MLRRLTFKEKTLKKKKKKGVDNKKTFKYNS